MPRFKLQYRVNSKSEWQDTTEKLPKKAEIDPFIKKMFTELGHTLVQQVGFFYFVNTSSGINQWEYRVWDTQIGREVRP